MSDLPSLIKSFKDIGYSNQEAKVEAKDELERAERKRERELACELFYCILLWFCFMI
jgi:hypothetical protein